VLRATIPRVTGTREFYEAGYSLTGDEGARMGRWRALGARSKSAHAIALCARAGLRPATLVEIGCGDGAVLAELAARGLSPVLDGFELSPKAAAIAEQRGVARRVEAFDGVHVPAADRAYDLAILSHVLEHVPEPLPLLIEAARVAPHVLVEVPLEDNRSARRPAKRRLSEAAGHLHAYSRASLGAQLRAAGLTPRHELADPLPYEHHAFFSTPARAAVKHAVRATAHRLAPRTAERMFTVHYAVLASAEQPLDPRQ
jgi:SAM-dependent methyltransferase